VSVKPNLADSLLSNMLWSMVSCMNEDLFATSLSGETQIGATIKAL